MCVLNVSSLTLKGFLKLFMCGDLSSQLFQIEWRQANCHIKFLCENNVNT